ncbi:MAG: 2,3-bisphosphoglycerate-independent phosphoglycerate mutase [Planctomycetota bacterium]
MPKKPIALIIRDGFGFNPRQDGNAVAAARTPNHDRFVKDHPTALIQCSGLEVGLPAGNQGSSEVGHLNLGAGRVVYQSLVRINKSVEDGSILANEAFVAGVRHALDSGGRVHVMGLVQDQGVHGHTDHLLAIMRTARQCGLPADRCVVHVFTDGRDTLPSSAALYVKVVTDFIAAERYGCIGTVCGRYYAMDRDNRWERVRPAYDMLVRGVSGRPPMADAAAAIANAYAAGETDEFIKPRLIRGFTPVADGDTVIHFNYRLDRTRELTKAFVEDGFSAFPTVAYRNLCYVCTMEYYDGVANSARARVLVAFPPQVISNLFGQYLADHGHNQLRIAETEKFAHVTFFFNGQSDVVFPREERVLIPSPRVATYDLQPEMSAPAVRDAMLSELDRDVHDVIVLNFANCDMVGHTGIYDAAVKAVETVDQCVGAVVDRILALDGVVLLTSDHGNAEQMVDYDTGEPMTAHTTNPVWLSLIARRPGLARGRVRLADDGRLADVVPTMLVVMGLEQPREMTGRSLIIKS